MSRAGGGHRLDIAGARYLDALEHGDFDALEAIWKQAETDRDLEAWLLELGPEAALGFVPEPEQAAPLEAEGRLQALQADMARPAPRQPEQLVDALYTDYRCRVLIVDDEPHIRSYLRRVLAEEFDVVEANSLATAREAFRRQPIDILLTDMRLKGSKGPQDRSSTALMEWASQYLEGPRDRSDIELTKLANQYLDRSGIELMEWAREHSPRTVPLLMSCFGETESVIAAINRGNVFHYLPKEADRLPPPEVIVGILRRASRAFTLERRNQELLERLKDLNMELEETVRRRTGELLEAMRELVQANKTLEKLALTDPLTGLPNRRAMDRLAERELLWRKRNPAPLAIGLVVLDHFDAINASSGRGGGDRVLTEVARCLSGSLREIDHLGRYGGEELMLIAPQADRHGAEVLGERLRRRVEELPILYRGEPVRVTVSVGLAVAERGTTADLAAMKDACEAALTAARAGGRNRCVVTTLPTDREVLARRARG
jgi:diguanylate cyclase (GGDEF)-like protein